MEPLWLGLQNAMKCEEFALFFISLREFEDNLRHNLKFSFLK